MMMLALADRLASELGDFLRCRHERVSLRVPGGTTPGPVFDVLSGRSRLGAGAVMLTTSAGCPRTARARTPG
jgi:hypothetical protein